MRVIEFSPAAINWSSAATGFRRSRSAGCYRPRSGERSRSPRDLGARCAATGELVRYTSRGRLDRHRSAGIRLFAGNWRRETVSRSVWRPCRHAGALALLPAQPGYRLHHDSNFLSDCRRLHRRLAGHPAVSRHGTPGFAAVERAACRCSLWPGLSDRAVRLSRQACLANVDRLATAA